MLLPPAVAQKLRPRLVQLRAVSRCCIVLVCQRLTMLRLLLFTCRFCTRLPATNKTCNSKGNLRTQEKSIFWCSGNIFFKSRLRHFSCRTLQSYNSPGDWARELFRPSTDSASLVVEIEKNNFRFRWRFFWRRRHKEDMFWKSRPLLAGPGPQPIDKSIIWPFRSNFGRP